MREREVSQTAAIAEQSIAVLLFQNGAKKKPTPTLPTESDQSADLRSNPF